jgi:hypothetical protein
MARGHNVRSIATLREGPLHAGLKAWYAEPGDRVEVPVEGWQIDLVRGDLLIEIQTGRFAALKRKLGALLDTHDVRLVHPVPVEKWIVRVDGDNVQPLSRRRSPSRGRVEHVFHELVSLPALLAHPRFSLEVILTREEEARRYAAGRAWRRRGWTIVERRVVDIVGRHLFREPRDLEALLPSCLPDPFTTADLASGLGVRRDLAQKMAYCLRHLAVIEPAGKRGTARTYRHRERPSVIDARNAQSPEPRAQSPEPEGVIQPADDDVLGCATLRRARGPGHSMARGRSSPRPIASHT